MNKQLQSGLCTLLFIFSIVHLNEQECVEMFFTSDVSRDEVVVDLRVNNFDEITVAQLGVTYTASNLEFVSISGNPSLNFNPGQWNTEIPGIINIAWTSPSVGVSIEDGASILQFRFTQLVDEPSSISFGTPAIPILFSNESFEEICALGDGELINDTRSIVTGSIFGDINEDCLIGAEDVPLVERTLLFDNGIDRFYAITNSIGGYTIPLNQGEYTVSVVDNDGLWSANCSGPVTLNIEEDELSFEEDFVLTPQMDCPLLKVSATTPRLRRCFDNEVVVRYRNDGTVVANDAYVEVRFDEGLDFVGTDALGSSLNGNVLTVPIGDAEPGFYDEFRLILNVNCETVMLQETRCIEAKIFPDELCNSPSEWSGAILDTQVSCDGDSIQFIITNISDFDMLAPLQSIVVEDDVMINIRDVDLAAQSNMTFRLEDNGSVYRLVTQQIDFYPLARYSSDVVYTCNDSDLDTWQYVSQFQLDDESPFVDIECHEIIGSYDPNDKNTFPVGYSSEHYIEEGVDIEYTIRFQNTGSDTAFIVYIEDEIDASLDLGSIEVLGASHEYTFEIKDGNVLRFDFLNINLVDSTTNEEGSNGFVQYRIAQKANLEPGTEIRNRASIYFDFNEAIVTNDVFHTIEEDFIDISLSTEPIDLAVVKTAPNPCIDYMFVEISGKWSDLSYQLININGEVVNAANIGANAFYIMRENINSGIYLLEILSKDKVISRKKIVIQ